MRSKGDRKGNKGDVVIRKEEVADAAHHGGAWKVAYADFVTAMMAFFLLMWLLNATTEDQRKGLADYFSPNNLMSHASSGTGEPFGGHTAFEDGALISDRGTIEIAEGKRPVIPDVAEGEVLVEKESGPRIARATTVERAATATPPRPEAAESRVAIVTMPDEDGTGPMARAGVSAGVPVEGNHPPTEAELQAERDRREKTAFEQAAQQIRDAVRNDPALADLARQLAIDMTPEGLRIQLLDEVRQPMFATGSAVPNERARLLLQKVTPVLMRLPQAISVAGHTDAAQFPGPDRTNWELSTERANATRRLMVDGGLPDPRIRTVTGHADRDPLLPGDPLAAANRRIAIVVLHAVERVAEPAGKPPPAAAPPAR